MKSVLAGVLALGIAAAMAAPASATFHLIKIREVHPDPSGDTGYVELQMYAPDQNLVGGHFLAVYNSGSYYVNPPYLLPSNVPNGQNQRTILIGDTGVQAATGVSPDFTFSNLLIPSQGSVCWLSTSSGTPSTDQGLDCVSISDSWGATPPPSPTGTPALMPAPGQSLIRKITPGCPTFLEASDDTDDSATDFAEGNPSPRNNATPPTESLCLPPDTTPPNTKLKKRPPNRTRDRTPTFRFTATESGSTFLCKLDRKKARRCTSPFTTKTLKPGPHTLKVTAIDAAGNRDPSPAKDTFKVIRR